MEKLNRKLSRVLYMLIVSGFLVGCTYHHDGKILMDEDGVIYKLEGNGRTSEAYHLIEIDTTDYRAKFNN